VKLWLDAQLSPALCSWLAETFDVDAAHVTKDRDFIDLVERLGPPPKIVWITVGNTSNTNLKRILTATLRDVLALLEQGEVLVEVSEHRP
jgi:predicted nuclease of predicted toxin-antitoxin system